MAILKKIFGGSEMAKESPEDDEYASEENEADLSQDLEEESGELAVDVFQTKDKLVVKSTIAGVKPEDLDITVAGDMVSIKGERKHEEAVDQDDYFYQECYWGSFSRTLHLPVEVDVNKVTAEIKDGVLILTMPKAARSRTKKVTVKGEK